MTAPSGSPRPKVTITATDFAFKAPLQVPAGYVDITLVNKGKEPHQAQLVKLDGIDFDEAQAAAAKTDIAAMQDKTVFLGGPNGAGPGASSTTTAHLETGTYALFCFIPAADGENHVAHGMFTQVLVVRGATSVETPPEVAGSIVLGDFTFELPKDFTGKGMFVIDNQGNQIHELALYKIADGKTLDDAKAYLLTPPGTPPPAGPPPITEGGGVVGLSPRRQGWLDLDLAPGNYVLMCFFPDPTKDDTPHVLEGMIKDFTIT